jgi:glycosyltransferase involved in cell wall biosynthesis
MPAKLTVVIPVYQNVGSIAESCAGISRVLEPHREEVAHEFVLVNDGSTDGSWEVMLQLREAQPERFTLVNLTRNFGQIAATLAGYTHARGDCLVTISADLQDPPELIWEMFQAWQQGHKLVIGQRVARNDGWLADRISRFSWTLLKRFAIPNIPQGGFDYFLMDAELKRLYLTAPEQNLFVQGRVLFFGYKPCLLPYERRKRTAGRSQFGFLRKIKYLVDGFVGYSYLPLRVMSVVGVCMFIFAAVYGTGIVITVFIKGRGQFQGWSSLMVAILALNGLQLLSMGVIGEYLWRAIEEIRGRPHFVTAQLLQAAGRNEHGDRPTIG